MAKAKKVANKKQETKEVVKKAKPVITVLSFLKSSTPYVKGDVAGVPTDKAETLIKRGIANEVK